MSPVSQLPQAGGQVMSVGPTSVEVSAESKSSPVSDVPSPGCFHAKPPHPEEGPSPPQGSVRPGQIGNSVIEEEISKRSIDYKNPSGECKASPTYVPCHAAPHLP